MLLSRLREIVGPAQVLTAPEDTAAYLTDWRGRFTANGGRAREQHEEEETHATNKWRHDHRVDSPQEKETKYRCYRLCTHMAPTTPLYAGPSTRSHSVR